MAAVFPGSARLISIMLGKTASENLALRLFINNHTPVHGDTAAAYTEASTSGTGYGVPGIQPSDWTVTPGTPDTLSTSQFNFGTLTATIGTVYGVFATGASSGLLYFAEAFSSPIGPTQVGDQIIYTPNYTLG